MGARCALDAAIVALLSYDVSLTAIASDWRAALFLALALVPAALSVGNLILVA